MNRILLSSALFVVFIASAWCAEPTAPHYRLKVSAQPESHELTVEAWVQNPPAPRFYLYKNFTVQRVDADGKAVTFHPATSAPPLPYSQEAVATDVDVQGVKELHIQYSGKMPERVFGVNTIDSDLLELASYSAWFPGFHGVWQYTYDLELNLPESFVAAVNGKFNGQRTEKGRSITTWSSFQPGFDIAIAASPKLKKFETDAGGTHVEIFASSGIPESVIREETEGLVDGIRQFTLIYGQPKVQGTLRIVYAPRDGWDYSRSPMFIVSEGRARHTLMGEAGEASHFRQNAHELAHFWWGFTGSDTPDNWIDEGLAEYSAFCLAEDRYGFPFARFQVGQYRRRIRTAQLTYAIAETPNNTIDREINRYDKASLMFLDARERFGRTSLEKALKAVYERFSKSPATTAAFLDEIEKNMGKEAAAYFREELYRKPVNEPVIPPEGK